MRWQGRHLRAGLSGSDVAELHEELIRLGYPVPEAERAEQTFGVGTAEAVVAFQLANGMLDTAVVEVIKRFLKLSLLAYRLQKEDDAALLIEDSDGVRQIYIV